MSTPATLEKGFGTKRSAVSVRGWALAVLSFQTLGIIYSDIGTSPLYVLNGIWAPSGPVPSKEDVIGGLSAIIWSLTILPLCKYVLVCLRFGTSEGEGGTYALFQGLFPPKHSDLDDDRTLTGDSLKTESTASKLSPKLWWPLLVVSLFGTSLTLADGVFTPAVSVTSAVGGIAVAKQSVANDVTPISIAFLVALFLIQSRGTSFLAYFFAPITFIWLLLLAITGIVNITHFPGIWRAFDPSRAVLLFVRTGNYDLLAGVLLAITGCEALFANLGQFNMASIQISFTFFVYPSLVLAYLGQGARLITDGDAVISNIFYNTIPGPDKGGLFWVMYVFAILATLIASQAMITATFSLIQQLINMRNLPAFRMKYTSEKIQGQVYIPIINWALMIVIIIVVAVFKSSTALTNAYGFAVATVMITTTVLVALQFKYVKGISAWYGLLFFLFFGFFDGLFWGAALRKIPHGAWVPLMIGLILLSSIMFWTWAKRLEDKFDGSTRENLRHIILCRDEDVIDEKASTASEEQTVFESSGKRVVIADDVPHDNIPRFILTRQYSHASDACNGLQRAMIKKPLARIPTCAIFHKLTTGRGVPHSFATFLRQWPALPRIVIFLSVSVLNVPRLPASERYSVTRVRSIEGFYGVTYALGFRDDFDVQVTEIIDRICDIEARAHPEDAVSRSQEIRSVAESYTHIVPYYMVSSRNKPGGKIRWVQNWVRRLLVEEVYQRISTMFPETANWLGSTDEIIHVGVNAVI
ncbi:potassium transporter [Phanerochaete sordida]|uniref:Potassium transporter n=1 Tax=Phanerochaete sordida TaxID=48140 RepID=A0A9P3LEA1_9APHY|nr:potassium transporter [Phanerochaete sordida]